MYRAADMLDDPHFKAREDIVTIPHPDFGEVAMQAVVPKMSGTPGSVRWPGPKLGAHNDEVLKGLLGLSEQDMTAITGSAR
jgi:formyl-CoA transferase